MVKQVLLVDDDEEMLLSLKQGLQRYRESFVVSLARDGVEGVQVLKSQVTSLVVTDLKMPRMDGFEFLAYVMENYPDVPVIIMTGYSTPQMEHLARRGGAIGYIAKPFMIDKLAHQILSTLRRESDGGTLHNVTSGMFLQLMEMEQKTCTIRLEDKLSGNKGVLFFKEGGLMDARIDDLHGEPAAHKIFSWDKVNLFIQNGCVLTEKKIQSDLQPLILEAMRLKDELVADANVDLVMEEPELYEPKPLNPIAAIRQRIDKELGDRCGVDDIYQDLTWDRRIHQLAKLGDFFNTGKLLLGYVDKGDPNDYILIPGEPTTVLAVSPKCPRDKLISLLSG
jgi:CheY-like chemotaxis protein